MLGSLTMMTAEHNAGTPAVMGATSKAAATSSSTEVIPPPVVEKPAQDPSAKATASLIPNMNAPAAVPALQTTGASPAPTTAAVAGSVLTQPRMGIASAPEQTPAAAAPVPAAEACREADMQVTATVRNAIIAKLREAAINADASLLRVAITEAEAAGMTAEADLSKRFLTSLSTGAPR